MINDVVALHNFYNSSLGRLASQDINNSIKKIWPSFKDQLVLGCGYTIPFLDEFDLNHNKVFAFMPEQQGVLRWPSYRLSKIVLVNEELLPLPDKSVDRILCIHMLEQCHDPHNFLQEVWRVLKPEGRILFIVANRRGLWARADDTPFGQGQPYTMTQLVTLLRSHLFTPLLQQRGLYSPPSVAKFYSFIRPLLEKMGPRYLQKFSGLVYIEVAKQMYGVNKDTSISSNLILSPMPQVIGAARYCCY